MRKRSIVVVDDDQSILMILSDYLTQVGYEVPTAKDLSSCLEIFASRSKDIDLAMLDIIIGLESGFELADTLEEKMPLPDLIEIVPPAAPVRARVSVPGSKSITNRMLILAALGAGETTLRGALWSEDTQVMVDCLRRLGFDVEVSVDPHEPCNRTLVVEDRGGEVPAGGTAAEPLELFVGNAGTAARFLAALTCLGRGFYRLQGMNRMPERPQAALFQALRELGYRIDAARDRLPPVIEGAGPRRANCRVSIAESCQFASALQATGKSTGICAISKISY